MRSNRWASVVMIGPLAGTLVGCGEEDIDSGDIKTHGIYADFTATATASDTTVDAVLLAGGKNSNTYVDLNSNDRLLATVGDTTHTLKGDSKGKHYTNDFEESEGGTLVTIEFDRDDDVDAPDSHVRLPDSFEMSLDASGQVPRNQDVVVTWEPAGDDSDTMYWWVSGDCIWDHEGQTDDDGRLTLSSDDIEAHDLDQDETCKVTVRLERHAHGTIDPAFGEGGRFLAMQRRTKTFMSAPVTEDTEPEATGGSSGTTETGGAGNTAGAPSAEAGGSSSASGGAGTGGAVSAEAGAAGRATSGSGTGGSSQAAAGSAGTTEAAAGRVGTNGGAGGAAG